MALTFDPTSGQWIEKPDIAPAPPAPVPVPVGAVPNSVRGAAPAAGPVASGMQSTAAGAGQYTPAERAYMAANMPDITGGEEQIARQHAMSDSLRGRSAGTPGRMDWASQASRALSGFGSGLAAKQAKEGRAGLHGDFRKYIGGWPGMGGGDFYRKNDPDNLMGGF